MTDESTKHEIDQTVTKTLKEAGMKEPPFLIGDLLDHLEIDRGFYDLEDPSFIRRFVHKVKVKGKILSKIKEKIKLSALWLPNKGHRDRIYVDSTLPEPKKKWASFHDATHGILEWHRPYFLGDTAQTLDPDFQNVLEAEAHYGASGLMFGGKVFTGDFSLSLLDVNGDLHEFYAQSFFNHYYILTLIVHKRKMKTRK